MISTRDAAKLLNATACICGRQKQGGTFPCYDCRRIVPAHMLSTLVGAKMDGTYERAMDGVIRCIRERRKTATQIGAGRHSPDDSLRSSMSTRSAWTRKNGKG